MPVTRMTYVPAGVPPLPPLLFVLPPPHATPKTKAANTHATATARLFPFLLLSEPKPTPATPISGNQSAYNGSDPDPECEVLAVAPVVLTVSMAGLPGVIEPGLIEHFGAIAGDGCTEQERATEPLNAEVAVIFTVAVDDPPGLTVLGVSPEAETEKAGASAISNTVPKLESPPAVVVP